MAVDNTIAPQAPIYVQSQGPGKALEQYASGARTEINGVPVALACTFTPAAGSANVCNVTIQFQDLQGNNLAQVFEFSWFLSDSSVGNGLTATTASGTVGAGSKGTDVYGKVSKKAGDALTDNTGAYVLSITDTAKTGFYVCVCNPGTGLTVVSAQLVTGNYG